MRWIRCLHRLSADRAQAGARNFNAASLPGASEHTQGGLFASGRNIERIHRRIHGSFRNICRHAFCGFLHTFRKRLSSNSTNNRTDAAQCLALNRISDTRTITKVFRDQNGCSASHCGCLIGQLVSQNLARTILAIAASGFHKQRALAQILDRHLHHMIAHLDTGHAAALRALEGNCSRGRRLVASFLRGLTHRRPGDIALNRITHHLADLSGSANLEKHWKRLLGDHRENGRRVLNGCTHGAKESICLGNQLFTLLQRV